MLECPQWVESCRLRQSVTFPAWQPAKLTRTAGFGQKRPLEVQCLNQKMYSHHFSTLMCPAVSKNEVNQSATEEDCPFVSLVLRLLDYDGEDLFSNVLMPWVEARPGAVAWLASLRGRGCNAVPTVQPEDLCRLYALNRVCEMLMLSLETAEPQARTGGHLALSMWQFEDFFSRLGIDAMRPKIFAPAWWRDSVGRRRGACALYRRYFNTLLGIPPKQQAYARSCAWMGQQFTLAHRFSPRLPSRRQLSLQCGRKVRSFVRGSGHA